MVKNQRYIKWYLVFGFVVLFFLFFLLEHIKVRYEEESEKNFLQAIRIKIEENQSAFMLSDVAQGDWDQVCGLFEVDDSIPVWKIHKFIKYKNLESSHWTQKFPGINSPDWVIEKIGGAQEYRAAFIFIKNDVVMSVVKLDDASFYSEIGEADCSKDFRILVNKDQNKPILKIYLGD